MANMLAFTNLLADATMPDWVMYVVIGVLFLGMIVWMFFSSRKRKKQQEEEMKLFDMITMGHKVITIGGISGIVVDKDDGEGTFVIETGWGPNDKSYIKIYKWAIRDSDAFDEYYKSKGINR